MLSSRGGAGKKGARGAVIYCRILHNDKKMTRLCQDLDILTDSEVLFFGGIFLRVPPSLQAPNSKATVRQQGSICRLDAVNYEQTGCFAHKRPRPLTFSKGKDGIKNELFDHQGGRK